MATSSLADFLREWRTLLATLQVNADALTYLEEDRARLEIELGETEAASIRQNLFKAQFHQATRDLEEHRTNGREVATRIRNSVRGHYGLSAEKLAEFGLQPRRFSRSRELADKPPEEGRTPSQAATPPTGGTIQEVNAV